jgi:hypothetical protein
MQIGHILQHHNSDKEGAREAFGQALRLKPDHPQVQHSTFALDILCIRFHNASLPQVRRMVPYPGNANLILGGNCWDVVALLLQKPKW